MTSSQENIDKQQENASPFDQANEEEKDNSRFPPEDTESVSVTSKDKSAALDPTSDNLIVPKVKQERNNELKSPS